MNQRLTGAEKAQNREWVRRHLKKYIVRVEVPREKTTRPRPPP